MFNILCKHFLTDNYFSIHKKVLRDWRQGLLSEQNQIHRGEWPGGLDTSICRGGVWSAGALREGGIKVLRILKHLISYLSLEYFLQPLWLYLYISSIQSSDLPIFVVQMLYHLSSGQPLGELGCKLESYGNGFQHATYISVVETFLFGDVK